MAIKINGTPVINDSQQLENITNLKTVAGQVILGTGNIETSGNYSMQVFTSSGTWTKPERLKAVKITAVGGGGASGNTTTLTATWPGGGGGGAVVRYMDAPLIPGPVEVSVGDGGNFTNPLQLSGNTSSFGVYATALGGDTGRAGGAGGSWAIPSPANFVGFGINGENGGTSSLTTLTFAVEYFSPSSPASPGGPVVENVTGATGVRGKGGNSILGFGGRGGFSQARSNPPPIPSVATITISGTAGASFGSGAGGQIRYNGGTSIGANGAPGIVIVEEFY